MDTIGTITVGIISFVITMVVMGIHIDKQQEKAHMRSQGMEWRKAGWYRVDCELNTTQSLVQSGGAE